MFIIIGKKMIQLKDLCLVIIVHSFLNDMVCEVESIWM